MKQLLYAIVFLGMQPLFGQIRFDKKKYQPGDNIVINADFPNLRNNNIQYATLYLVIEDVCKSKRWQYRYPVTDGAASAKLSIDKNMPHGQYAFNFLLRKRFFSIQGVLNYNKTGIKLPS